MYDEYKQAAEDIQAKLLDFWNAFEAKDKGMKQNVKDGKITQKQYDNWRVGQFVVGTRWLNLLEELATDLHNTNAIAHSMIYDYVPAAYAENHNFMTYQIEHKTKINTSFTLYNHEAVERIMTENPQMLPPPGKKRSARIAAGEEAAWNKKQIQSVATQAILQGESIPEVAHRLAETVGERNMNAAVRDARTMMTNAENLGREDSIKRANDLGIPTRKVWLATLDGRTRHAHRRLDGQVVDEDKVDNNPAEQLDMFADYEALARQREAEQTALDKERRMQEAVLSIKRKFSKNAIFKGMDLEEGATARERNAQIGGHKA